MRPRTQTVLRFLLIGLLLIAYRVTPVFAQAKAASDPTRIGVGARPMGMGKAYIGMSDDVSSLFMNPAGISTLKAWQLTSMQTKLLDEFNYLVLGATAFPTQVGVFGVGFVGAGIGITVPIPTLVTVGSQTRVVPSTESASFNFQDNVILLSYGTPLSRFLKFALTQDLSLGATLKLFSTSLTGTGISGGNGSGMDMDAGLLYQPKYSWFSGGLAVQNLLPFSAGGKIKYASGSEETLPSTVKFGSAFRIMGLQRALIKSSQELSVLVDADVSPRGLPTLFHMGAEWWPVEYGAVRAGINQDAQGRAEVVNNLTAGVSLLFQKFRFDFSFHQFNAIQENNTYIFSLNYGVEREKAPEKPLPPIELAEPEDKLVTDLEQITVRGEIPRKNVSKVVVGDQEISTAQQKNFEAIVPLKMGKNIIVVKGYKADSILPAYEKKLRVLRLVAFRDVPGDYWAKRQIGVIGTLGLVGGYPDGSFRPDGDITRAELTTLLVRARGVSVEAVRESVFSDLPKTHWAAAYAKKAIEMGLVKGYPDGTFRPARNINRAEGVTVMARFANVNEPEAMARTPYADISGRHWAAKIIMAAKDAGLLKYLGEGDFRPDQNLTRAEAVEMMFRTSYGSDRAKELLDFDQGYIHAKEVAGK